MCLGAGFSRICDLTWDFNSFQVQIPGLAQPISLSFSNNTSNPGGASLTASGGATGQHAGLLVSVPVSSQQQPTTTQTVVLTNNQAGGQHGQMLPIPFGECVDDLRLPGSRENII